MVRLNAHEKLRLPVWDANGHVIMTSAVIRLLFQRNFSTFVR